MKKTTQWSLTVLTLAAMTACGGGGGSTPTSSTVITGPATPGITAPAVSNIVTTAPLANYGAGTEELAAFSRLNTERGFCGFGVVAQNAALDKAALAHANWQIANNSFGHYETTGTPFFTGATPENRITAAGYETTNAITDENTGNAYNLKTGYGEIGMRALLNAPYHVAALMTGYREVGISLRNSTDLGAASPNKVLQLNLASRAADGQQILSPTEVRTYPCDGSSGINPKLSGENPNPVPGRSLFNSPLGSTVYVALREGNVLAIISTTMINMATGAPVALRAPLTSANDPNATPNGSYFRPNQALIIPDVAMDPLTRYQVTINGTNNGVAFSRTFAFTTGPATTQ